MKSMVLKIFVLITIISISACNTGKENGQTQTDEFYLEEYEAAEESAEMMRKTEADVYDMSDMEKPIVDPDEGEPDFNTEEYDKIVENVTGGNR